MEDKEVARMQKLHEDLNRARAICDPIEFPRRQQILLYSLAEHLLEPFYEYERKRIKDSDESDARI
jgi:hypothetical protein